MLNIEDRQAVVFQNAGELDIMALKIMGISVKETDSPIGFFGTGLKFAIAVLVKNDISVSILIGSVKYTFKRKSVHIRTKPFDIIQLQTEYLDLTELNGCPTTTVEDLGYTTELGKNWEVWMSYRELYCNCIDEPKSSVNILPLNAIQGEKNKTKIIVHDDRSDFLLIHEQRDSFILNTDVLVSHSNISIHKHAPDSGCCFYHKICVLEYPEFLFSYNFTVQMELTEDRTLKSEWEHQYWIKRIFSSYCKDADIIKRMLLAPENSFEAKISFNMYDNYSDIFLDTVESLDAQGFDVNTSALKALQACRNRSLKINEYICTLEEQSILDLAIDFCISIGYDVNDYKIIITDSFIDAVYGRAHNDIIYLSKKCFQKSMVFFASTLLEEYIHLRYGLSDHTRELQTFLFDEIIRLGIKHITKTPLVSNQHNQESMFDRVELNSGENDENPF